MAQARRAATRKPAARKRPVRKRPVRKPAARKSAARPAARAAARRSTPARRTTARRTAARRTTTRRAAPKRAARRPAAPPAPPGAGIFIWHELMTPSAAAAKAFYGKLFGWGNRSMNVGPMTYTIFTQAGKDHAGMMEMSGPAWQGVPPSWMQYVHVTDVDASTRQARELGGQVMREPMDIPGVGRFAVLKDPAGAVLAIFKPSM